MTWQIHRWVRFLFLQMENGFGESTSRSPSSPSCTSSSNNNDACNFECNICFDLAQDPIITLCGHLFCWPCLYKWLHLHSQSRECPVCKALIEEQKLVSLYGRGKKSTDPRSKPNPFSQHGFGFTELPGGFAHESTARSGNFTLSAAFGGLIPFLFNFQLLGLHDVTMYGAAGFPYGFLFHSGHVHRFPPPPHTGQVQQDYYLKRLLLFVIFCVLLALIWK